MLDLSKTSYLQLKTSDIDLKPQLDSLPVLLCGLSDKATAANAKEYLKRFFAPDTPVCLYFKDKSFETVLEKIDSEESVFGEDCRALVVPKTGFNKKVYTFGDLIRILERLTDKDGCPWDKEQTHQSIRSNMIEEAYEAALAISSGDKDNLIEELGDVLLQSVFHADIAKRSGEFALKDVISALCGKLYTRHTHIFGDKKADDSSEALKNWEEAKAAEKGGEPAVKSYAGLPSLMRAQKVFKKHKASLLQKTQKEKEIKKDTDFAGGDLGQALFTLAAKCSDFGIDAETELNAYIDRLLKDQGGNF